MDAHLEVIGARQKIALARLGPIASRHGFYLGGGTAIALRLGHRHSVDLDWFTQTHFGPDALNTQIRSAGIPFIVNESSQGTLHGSLSGVRVSWLEYQYPLLTVPTTWSAFECNLASLEDLCCMKLVAVAQRGAKKDFLDLHALVRHGLSLEQMLALFQKKYATRDIAHIVYALAYFDDADSDDMPRMLVKTDWRSVKRDIRRWVRQLS